MRGRYVSPDEASIEREFTLVRAEWHFPPSYNVAPTQKVPAVRVNKAGERTGALLHWGLIPYWAKGVQPKFSTINATVEKITDAATWRGPWKRGQRCILPALGFYEWQVLADGKNKQPYYITLNDQDTFGFAGLSDSSAGADGIKIESCTIVTMPANKLHGGNPQCQTPHARDHRKELSSRYQPILLRGIFWRFVCDSWPGAATPEPVLRGNPGRSLLWDS